MKNGVNQGKVREDNLSLALELLRREPLSSSDLAKSMKLSKPALTKIMDDMIELSLVSFCEENKSVKAGKGRKKQLYKINCDLGIIGTIVFHSTTCEIAIFDLQLNKLDSDLLEDCEFLTYEELNDIREKLSRMVEKTNKKILSICIATPGKVRKEGNILDKSPKLENIKDINLETYFKSFFQCDVFLKNDMNLYLVAEMEHGSLQNTENAALIYIDSGIGGAILLNSKLLEGDHGFAGEFGLSKAIGPDGEMNYLDAISSTNSIKDRIRFLRQTESTELIGKFKFKNVVDAFYNQDALTRKVVFESAKPVGLLISDIYNILDCENIRLCGRIRLLGEEYLKSIESNLGNEKEKIHLQYTDILEDAISIGAAEVAVSTFFHQWIKNRKKVKDEEN